MSGSYKDLRVWQESFALSIAVYRLTVDFPRDEIYGLSSQLRRAAVSIPSNIAEGYGRGTRKDSRSFVSIARGSTLELQTQIGIANEMRFGKRGLMEKAQFQAEEVGKMLWGLLQKL
ncbi:MAG TPA: four helix bundle protein [Acidobacteriaceae bacterium]